MTVLNRVTLKTPPDLGGVFFSWDRPSGKDGPWLLLAENSKWRLKRPGPGIIATR
jgi:hypothetical protein